MVDGTGDRPAAASHFSNPFASPNIKPYVASKLPARNPMTRRWNSSRLS